MNLVCFAFDGKCSNHYTRQSSSFTPWLHECAILKCEALTRGDWLSLGDARLATGGPTSCSTSLGELPPTRDLINRCCPSLVVDAAGHLPPDFSANTKPPLPCSDGKHAP